jgi:Flp pilus assembly protein protease CpaA
MGFGDVKLLTILSLLLGKSIFLIIICSLVIVMLVNLIKKVDKIPLGFYLSFSTIVLFFLGVLKIDL